MGIYKRKQENTLSTKRAIIERKHALDAESEKMKNLSFFLDCFLVESVFSFFFSYFLVFFINSHLSVEAPDNAKNVSFASLKLYTFLRFSENVFLLISIFGPDKIQKRHEDNIDLISATK